MILRLVTAFVGFISSITFIIGIVYYHCDYEFNDYLNMYISDYTILFMYVCAVVFACGGILFLKSAYNFTKNK